MDLALYDSRRRLLRPRRPTIRARGRFFYQRRRRPGVRRAAGNPARRNGRSPGRRRARTPEAADVCVRSRRGRRRKRPPVRRYPARGAPPRSGVSSNGPPCIWSRRAPAPAAPSARRSATSPIAWHRRTARLPPTFEGVLVANELLDALPVHQVVMRATGLREVYVDRRGPIAWCTREGPPSTPALRSLSRPPRHRARDRVARGDQPPRARLDSRSAGRLRRGFVILIDYGHEASELYSGTHSAGTLTTSRATRWPDRNRRLTLRPG